MSRIGNKSVLLPSLLLVLLLLAAQSAGLVHAYEHEPGTPQNKTCTSCIVASQLASACVDAAAPTHAVVPGLSRCTSRNAEFQSFPTIIARQRGPPATL